MDSRFEWGDQLGHQAIGTMTTSRKRVRAVLVQKVHVVASGLLAEPLPRFAPAVLAYQA